MCKGDSLVTGPKRDLTSIAVTQTVRELVRRAVLRWSNEVGQQLPMSTIVHAALVMADQHSDEFATALRSVMEP